MSEIKERALGAYEATLSDILHNGYDHIDRTGVGRRTIVGVQTRYDLSGGVVPIPTTRRIPHRGAVKELVWMIKGLIDGSILTAANCHFWDRWTVKDEHIDAFLEANEGKYDPAVKEQLREAMKKHYHESIGPMYGAMWRNAPNSQYNTVWPVVPKEEMPSDKLTAWQKEWDAFREATQAKRDEAFAGFTEEQQAEFLEEEKLEEQHFFQSKYYETVDQFNELIRNLKIRPFSSRLVTTAWVPEYVSFEGVSPQFNVLMNKGALTACHAMFQCFVKPPKEEGGKKRLSLLMYQRSADFPVGVPSNITQYSVLTHLLAHETGMEADEFIHSVGDAHIYLDQIELVKKQLEREPLPFPTISINPDLKDIFQVTAEDVVINNYVHSEMDSGVEVLKYPVAV